MDENDRATAVRDQSVAEAHSKSAAANIVGWLALILSIIALALAWMAYDNVSDTNLSEMIQNELQATPQVEQQPQDTTNDNNLNNDALAPGTDDSTMENGTTAPEDGTGVPEGDTTTPPNTN